MHYVKRMGDVFIACPFVLLLTKKMQNGHPLTGKKVTVYGNEHMIDSEQFKYFEKILRFLQPANKRDEREKDIWELDRLDIAVRDNPIYNVKTLNFTKISQTDMREETKKAVFCVSERVISQSVVLRRDRQGYPGGIPDNAHIARMDEQIARCLVIHQMLGTRISDTLTLRRDCLLQRAWTEHDSNPSGQNRYL